MKTITRCLNEWNATIEALGQGIQTILIRKYETNLNGFLFNPTISYTLKDGYVENFKKNYQSFVKENSYPKKEGKKTEIKYYATVEKIIDIPANRIGSVDKFHIWTKNHVKNYMGLKNPKIWILRVYKLEKPVMATHRGGQTFVHTTQPISLEGIKPVLNDSEFYVILNKLI